ncbi:MAG: methyltransferase domain-containing protein [Dehalococcoidia bacterium]
MTFESERRSRDHYERRAGLYDWANRLASLLRGTSGLRERRKAVKRLRLRPGQRVLEVSVGTGTNVPLLAEEVGPEGRIVGVDISPAMLERRRRKLERHGLRADLVLGEAAHLPLAAASFQAVLHHGGLAEFGDRRGAIEEMVRVAAPGARVVICDAGVPAEGKPSLVNRLLLRFQPEYRRPPPLDLLPEGARDRQLSWFHGGGWYMIEFEKP